MKRAYLLTLGLALGLGLAFAALRLWAPYYLEVLELRTIDFRQQARGSLAVGDEVVIAAVDEKSVKEIGRWPWSRVQVAALVTELTRLGAVVIALDIVFAEPEPGRDEELAEAIRRSGKVVLGYFFNDVESWRKNGTRAGSQPTDVGDPAGNTFASEYNLVRPGRGKSPGEARLPAGSQLVPNIPLVAEAGRRAGYFNFIPDVDGIYRRVPLAIRYQGKLLVPLSLEALRMYQGNPMLALTFLPEGVASVALGTTALQTDEAGELWINYAGPAQSFPHVSAADLIAGRVPAERIQGKIVFIGMTAVGIYDLRATPVDPALPGVEIHANVIDNILRGRSLIRPNWLIAVDMSILCGLGLVIGIAFLWFRGVWGGLCCGGTLGAYLWGSQLFFVRSGVPLSIIYPALLVFALSFSVTLMHYMTEERQKRRLRTALGLYLHPEMARRVSHNPSALRLGGDKLELSVLFSDIRGFTAISEGLTPEALVAFLNEYFGVMTDIVFAQEGLLDKYIGDGIMALWGAPLPLQSHAARACRTALDMHGALTHLQESWRTRGLPPFEIGVGINTGPMVIGNMGSSRRFNYTVVGDHVNLGARLEGLNKVYGTTILVSEYTRARLGDEFLLREIDAVRVKGKQQRVLIYELLARMEHADGRHALVADFAAARQAYQEQHWEKACQLFSALARAYPQDGPTRVYLQRCILLQANPPPADWDGVFVMESK